MRLIWGLILISTSVPFFISKYFSVPYAAFRCVIEMGVGSGCWMEINRRYDQINVTYKSTEKIVPIMRVFPSSPSD